MKVSDIIARFLGDNCGDIFTVSGGACLHVLDSMSRLGVKYVCTQHEQAAGYAADSQSRLGKMGCALVTSGPGASNLATCIATSYYDSVPVLYLTGQQSRSRLDLGGCRQVGFQGMPTVEIFTPIAKYAVTVMQPEDIIYELEKALYLAREGRPGPVLVDVPDDLQRLEVEESQLHHFRPSPTVNHTGELELQSLAPEIVGELIAARRPLLIYGWGLRLAGVVEEARHLARFLNIPVAATWAVRDAFPEALCFGTHGTKAGNLAVQQADYILSIGSRLDTKATSSPVSLFAPQARLSMVEIDGAELAKMARFGRPLYRAIQADARDFLRHVLYVAQSVFPPPDSPWNRQVAAWSAQYRPRDTHIPYERRRFHGPYSLVERLSDLMTGDEIVVSDTGNTLGWLMQGFRFKGQRFLHPFNNTPMGYGLPGALGAALATGKRVVCITGDGSIMMSIGELATIAKHCGDVKVICLNNQGHSMCRYTQRQWLQGRFAGTGDELAFPHDFAALARSMGAWRAQGAGDYLSLDAALKEWWMPGLSFLEVMVDPQASLAFQVKFGKPLEDCEVVHV